MIGSSIINDKIRRYDGYDYEKVMLTTQMALNQLAVNDFDGARADPLKFAVSREVFKNLERVTDAFEDVANEIDGIVIDHS